MDRTVGQLAAQAGITVRTLHHYDELGLVTPMARTSAGHRRYGEDDVRRLYRVRALAQLGVPLADIPAALRDGGLRDTVAQQLDRVEAELAQLSAIRDRLRHLLDAENDHPEEILEIMHMAERHFTPEQLAQLAERRAELGHDGLRAAHESWATLYADVRAARADGVPPADPRAQALLARMDALIAQFTGGDAGIRTSLQHAHEERMEHRAARDGDEPELQAWLQEVRVASAG